MLNIKKLLTLNELHALKAQYFSSSTAPLDGMWHFGFVPMSPHFGIYEDNTLAGFFVVNDDGYLLQFYLSPSATSEASLAFTSALHSELADINGAFVSTAEPDFLSLCLDNTSTFEINSMMYQLQGQTQHQANTMIEMQQVTPNQLNELVQFAATNIGAPEQWLSGYYGRLIERNELWGYWLNNTLLATGECRLFDEFQTQYADLGMIVAQSERGKGIATQVLQYLVHEAQSKGLTPICSTENNNIAAQKAIGKAGMRSSNRIVQFKFSRSSQ